MSQKQVVFTTFGSLGDLHPYLAIGLELKFRGYDVVIATLELYRETVESLGLTFRLLRSSLIPKPDRSIIERVLDPKHGFEFIVRSLLMPAIRVAYGDTLEAIKAASLVVSHPLTLASRLAAEVRGIEWISTQLSPMGFFSRFDPPALPRELFLPYLYPLGPRLLRPIFAVVRNSIRQWTEPYDQLRNELKLSPDPDPLFSFKRSPSVVLALFSEGLGAKQRDWPSHSVITGFPFFDADGRNGLTPELARFLDSGPPPLVFTLGTSAVLNAGRFYQESSEAARVLGHRAVLLVGPDDSNRPSRIDDDAICVEYAPYSQLFPRASVLVHQGGIGTTAQAMRSGRPMLISPYALDQPDNAARAERLEISRTVSPGAYSAQVAATAIDALLSDKSYERRGQILRQQIAKESGARRASDELETLLA